MPIDTTRRATLLGIAACLTAMTARAAAPSDTPFGAAVQRIEALEQGIGGRLGVAVIDTASGAMLAHRANERFPMCSTFKLLASAAVLAKVDIGTDRLDRFVAYGTGDLLGYAPVTKAHASEGGMQLGELCAAAIAWSDNTAANLILDSIGGPEGFTAYVRALGDGQTRLDRTEPTLNTALPGDARDTTTPLAMVTDMIKVFVNDALSPTSRRQLIDWLINDKVGGERIRAGVPATWRVGDKTGTGDHGTSNTLAILMPPNRAPLIAAVYMSGSDASPDARNSVHKAIDAIISTLFVR